MITMQQIKSDLREIRYYYAKQKDLDNASHTVGASKITEIAKRYNDAVQDAPIRLYDVYVSLYINNRTQYGLAVDWNCSLEYIKRLNRQLCDFLLEKFNKREGGD
ncbi:MAG: hypothetical protein NC548_35525 [Lachnospiraceae bacterium]|nr:hypothetical protein [Lachnospiraceae bacterium]